jgi:3-deoxy-manno-octulosonate cytidylyltransferase (CMP-KDO synthetase)
MKVLGVIPARYASSRFPGKVLVELGGKSILQRVWEQCTQAHGLDEILIATDHPQVYKHAQHFGARVVMTADDHPSGTDRIAEAMMHISDTVDVVVNIQGDEPFISPDLINQMALAFDDSSVDICTAAIPIENQKDIQNPNVVKVVSNSNRNALYFSRSAIPFLRGINSNEWLQKADFYKHIGIYAYRKHVLKQLVQLPLSPLEIAESLEQLRWLEAGYTIRVLPTHYPGIGIDHPDDLIEAEKFLNLQQS